MYIFKRFVQIILKWKIMRWWVILQNNVSCPLCPTRLPPLCRLQLIDASLLCPGVGDCWSASVYIGSGCSQSALDCWLFKRLSELFTSDSSSACLPACLPATFLQPASAPASAPHLPRTYPPSVSAWESTTWCLTVYLFNVLFIRCIVCAASCFPLSNIASKGNK